MTDEADNAVNGWIAFDRVEIDLVGRRLFVADATIALEPKAFDVLAFLVRNAGRALTRDEILDAVWGHRHVTPGVLNRIVTLLRHALGESAEHTQYLHTLRGIGYRFDLPEQTAPEQAADATLESAPSPIVVAPDAQRIEATPTPDLPLDPPASPSATSAVPHGAPRRVSRRAFELALLVLLIVCGPIVWTLWPRAPNAQVEPAPAPASQQSVAVLPFANATGDADQQYFADGISENLINTLAQYAGLKVIGRSSAFGFRDSREGAKSIGIKLGVTHLIEGSVQRNGDALRIVVELVRVADGSTVWTQKFDRPYKDLFALQDEITLAVASALQLKLLRAMPGAVNTGRPSTGNLEAYSAYLRGTAYMASFDLPKAMEQFAQATQIDPAYAQAWAWLGHWRTVHALNRLHADAARDEYQKAREEIETALHLQPEYGQAHAIYANWLRTAKHDWSGALAQFHIALPLVPDNDPTHGAYSILLSALGHIDEAIAERRKYIDGDPLHAGARMCLVDLQASLGRLDEAEASLREAAALDPGQADWYASKRVNLAILRGDESAALAAASSMTDGQWREQKAALALQIGSDRKAADNALRQVLEKSGQGKYTVVVIAQIYALRGDADKTFEWLQSDAEHDDVIVQTALFDPLLLRFRDDPRFAAYCQRAGLPLPSASEALSIDQIRAKLAAKP